MAKHRPSHTTPGPDDASAPRHAPDFVLYPDPTTPTRLTTAPPACPVPELTRVPLVPEPVLQAHDAHVPGDTRFRRAPQGCWPRCGAPTPDCRLAPTVPAMTRQS